MKFSELPIETQKQLLKERDELSNKSVNTPYRIHVYSFDGKRYLTAVRRQRSWSDNRGNYMPFGGGSYWDVTYGEVNFRRFRNPVGEWDYELVDGNVIRKFIQDTKKEVISAIKSFGIFNI